MGEENKTMPGRNNGTLRRGGSTGRPRKLVSTVTAALNETGVAQVSSNDVNAAYKTLLNLKESELSGMVNDRDQPMLIRIVAKAMLSGKGYEVVEKMMERVHGKPASVISLQKTEGGTEDHDAGTTITGINFVIVGGDKNPITRESDLPTL